MRRSSTRDRDRPCIACCAHWGRQDGGRGRGRAVGSGKMVLRLRQPRPHAVRLLPRHREAGRPLSRRPLRRAAVPQEPAAEGFRVRRACCSVSSRRRGRRSLGGLGRRCQFGGRRSHRCRAAADSGGGLGRTPTDSSRRSGCRRLGRRYRTDRTVLLRRRRRRRRLVLDCGGPATGMSMPYATSPARQKACEEAARAMLSPMGGGERAWAPRQQAASSGRAGTRRRPGWAALIGEVASLAPPVGLGGGLGGGREAGEGARGGRGAGAGRGRPGVASRR
jgi:hypothetical protein